jgi:hypothetical protein
MATPSQHNKPHNTQPNLKSNGTMIPSACCPPVVPVLKVNPITIQCMIELDLRYMAMQFLCVTNFIFILFAIIL